MSATDSPRVNCISSPRRTIGVAPSSATPTSNETRVRVEGRSKTRATLRPGQRPLAVAVAARPAFSSAARSSSCDSSKAPSSSPVRKSRFVKRRILRRVRFTALAWNLFHGRDFPPDPALFTCRSRLLRVERAQRDPRPAQPRPAVRVRRAAVGGRPGTWRCCRSARRASPRRLPAPAAPRRTASLTSRNSLGALRALAARINPDLIASGEGGSNLTLIRRGSARLGAIAERRELTIHAGRPERRAMALRPHRVRRLRRQPARHQRPPGAGDRGRAGGGERSLGLGGRGAAAVRRRPQPAPGRDPRGLRAAPSTASASTRRPAPDAIDHLLVRGLETVEPPRPWPPERRELRRDGLALRLSDHAPVEAVFDDRAATVVR